MLVLLLGVLFLTACEKAEIPLPQGVQVVRGYLQPVPFSLKRRGTHALYTGSGGTMIVYAESTGVNLRLLEGQDVELEGVFEKNSEVGALPVLVVGKILAGSDEQMRPWAIPALGLSVNLPKSWKGSIKGGSATFTASGFTMPVLTITARKTARAASGQPVYGPLPVSSPGELLVVGLRKALADVDAASEAWVVRVAPSPSGTSETIFTFALQSASPVASQVLLYRNILKTVEFKAATMSAASSATSSIPQSGSSASATSGSRAGGEGSVCGGVAGILCPKGLFCKITDAVSESGVCTKR